MAGPVDRSTGSGARVAGRGQRRHARRSTPPRAGSAIDPYGLKVPRSSGMEPQVRTPQRSCPPAFRRSLRHRGRRTSRSHIPIRWQICRVGALKIYSAGPLFTPYERSFIDECAATLRVDGFEVFVPHEHELATEGVDLTAAWIFARDRSGIERADAMLAILDGPSVDD